GRVLPMQRLRPGLDRLASGLGSSPADLTRAADAILTSDTRNKRVGVKLRTPDGREIRLCGIAKGAGMIEPNMATMLAFLCTDAAIPAATLRDWLREAVGQSFNRISVDGDMSTNDTVLILANGASDIDPTADPALAAAFRAALVEACRRLAKMIVGDGERISHTIELRIKGAPTAEAAEKVARAIGNSLLVKSSWYGNDPNWGRLVDAAGYARVGLDFARLDLFYDEVPAVRAGQPIDGNLDQWKAIVARHDFTITLDLHLGSAETHFWTTDLTEGYVAYNKSE
ncbi:MAG: bifunctional ornithine acetyltransferase/N-acetylglutamate synthase, partial [Verrucomicrobiota bacterium]